MAGKKGLREYITLECQAQECKNKVNDTRSKYRTSKQMKPRGQKKEAEKLALKKYCRFCKCHVLHVERKK